MTLALLVAGVVAFERRDVGSATALSWLHAPSLPGGVGGPFRRQLSDRTAIALGGGAGIGLYAALIASVAPSFLDILKQSPDLLKLIQQVYPAIDLTQPSGLLQLAFAGFASMILGLLGAFFVAGWASDEGRRRTDLVLTTPVRRTSWMIRSGLALYVAILIAAVTMAVLVALRIGVAGADVVAPSVGILVIALAVMGLCGIGLAAGRARPLGPRPWPPSRSWRPSCSTSSGRRSSCRTRSSSCPSTNTSASRWPAPTTPSGSSPRRSSRQAGSSSAHGVCSAGTSAGKVRGWTP